MTDEDDETHHIAEIWQLSSDLAEVLMRQVETHSNVHELDEAHRKSLLMYGLIQFCAYITGRGLANDDPVRLMAEVARQVVSHLNDPDRLN